MKSVYLKEPWQVALREGPVPTPGPGDALIRVRGLGICGSDVTALRGTNPLITYPRVLGHEIAGEVLSIPPNNPRGLKAGDHVIVDPYLYCGACYPCSIGRTNCCESLEVLGVHRDGGMAEIIAHPAHMLWRLPEDMPWHLAPLAEPLTISLHGLHRGRLAAGEHVLILGAGAIGLYMAMAALHYGAVPIVADPVAARLALAAQVGVPHTIDLSRENAEERVRAITGGRMAELVAEASGANAAVRSTLDLVAQAGRIVLTGWPKTPTLLPTDVITRKEVDILGGRTSANEFEEAIRLVHTGGVDVARLLTEVVALDDIPATLTAIEKSPQHFLKVSAVLP